MKIERLKYKFVVFGSIFCFIQLFISTGCIDESIDPCPSEEYFLNVTVRDILTNRDITEVESLQNIKLYLFDSEKKFLESLEIPATQVINRTPIDLTNKNVKDGYAVVWANLNDQIIFHEPEKGQLINELSVTKKTNEVYPDYHLCSGDPFYGYIPLTQKIRSTLTSENEIEIKRKNGQLHITVQGIEPDGDPDDYFFKISSLNFGYNFEGAPINTRTNIRENGVFQEGIGYTSPTPYQIIHFSPDVEINEENCMTIHLMKTDKNLRAGESELITANKDIEGNFITIESGKTTNVLIQIGQSGSLTVHIVTTPWDEIYQWSEW